MISSGRSFLLCHYETPCCSTGHGDYVFDLRVALELLRAVIADLTVFVFLKRPVCAVLPISNSQRSSLKINQWFEGAPESLCRQSWDEFECSAAMWKCTGAGSGNADLPSSSRDI